MARMYKYTLELATEICDAIACSSKGINAICKENEHFPSHQVVYKWLNMHEDFQKIYARAKQRQIEVFMNDIVEISADSSNDFFIDEETGRKTVNSSSVPRSRLQVDTMKWLASKLAPKIYGGALNADETVTVDTADMKRRKQELDKKNQKDY